MDIVFAAYTDRGCEIEIAVECPACGEIIRLGIKGVGYEDYVVFRNKPVECDCGMFFYPPVVDMRAKVYIRQYRQDIMDCLRSDVGRGRRNGTSRRKDIWKKKKKVFQQFYERFFGT